MENLLSNAVKFTPEGGEIGLYAHRHNGAVEISITDTGIGIAREDKIEYEEIGEIAFKGISRPIPMFNVVGFK